MPRPDNWPRTILHVDIDAFYTSVHQRDDPKLRGVPVAVAGRSRRAVVMGASYEARAFGVRSAMPLHEAMQLCPQLIVVSPDGARYREASRLIHQIFRRFASPELVEGVSLDEAYLDVTARTRHGTSNAEEVARRIKFQIHTEVGLTASVGAGGAVLQRMAQGRDRAPVDGSKPAKTISAETTFENDVSDRLQLDGALRELTDRVVERLKAEGVRARTVYVKLKLPDFRLVSRQVSRTSPTDDRPRWQRRKHLAQSFPAQRFAHASDQCSKNHRGRTRVVQGCMRRRDVEVQQLDQRGQPRRLPLRKLEHQPRQPGCVDDRVLKRAFESAPDEPRVKCIVAVLDQHGALSET